MTAGRWDFSIEQGATFDHTVSWQGEDGIPIDLAGYVAELQMRTQVFPPTLLIMSSADSGSGLELDPEGGTIRVFISAEATGEMKWMGSQPYVLILRAPDGYVTRLLEGEVTISALP